MLRTSTLLSLVLMFATQTSATAVTLDEVFSNFQKCNFKGFYYAPWDTSRPIHPYFAERNLKPYKENNGVYYFKVKDSLFGLPVSEIMVPGTWDYHGVVFDAPLAKTREVMNRKFGTAFVPSDKSKAGESPALEKTIDASQSGLYCNETEGGF